MVAVLFGSLVAACDSSNVGPPDELQVLKVPSSEADTEALLAWAENVIAGRCMVSKGYSFAVSVFESSASKRRDPLDELYGTSDIEEARERGYGINQVFHAGGEAAPDPNRAYLASLSKEDRRRFDVAYFGPSEAVVNVDTAEGRFSVGAEGCLADARSQLYGGIEEWAPLDVWVTGLDSQVYATVVRDPGYKTTLRKWRQCMVGLKHSAADPGASRERVAELARSLNQTKAAQLERTVAVADAVCNKESGLRHRAGELHQSHAAEVLRDNQDRAADYQRRRNAAVAVARDLVVEVSK
ncbi:hypothetical protein [Micromonospora sp. DT229]|uniref:hypothetical protein n=1 Tax=Micromonospora sp. DT229 TaxID=3393430 RepID=UPI003CF6C3ED